MKKYNKDPERWSYRIRQGEKILATNLFKEDVIVRLNEKEDDEILRCDVDRLDPNSNIWQNIPVLLTDRGVALGDAQ